MGKRRGADAGIDMQVQKEAYNVDVAESPDANGGGGGGGGGWQRADDSLLQGRSIRKIKRSGGAGSAASALMGSTPAAASEEPKPRANPFATINLTADDKTTAKPFSFESSSSKPAASGLFGSIAPPSESKPAGGLFGSSTSTSSAPLSSSSSSSASKSAGGLFSSSATSTASAGAASATTTTPANTADGPSTSGGKSQEYLKNVAALNGSFCDWLNEQMRTKPKHQSLVDGVREYIKYARKEIAAEKSRAPSSSPAPTASTSGPGLFGAGLFGGANTNGSASASSAFGALPTGSSSGLFGSGGAGGPAMTGNSLFGGPANGSASVGGGGSNEEDALPQAEPTTVEDNIQDDEEQLFKVKAKVMNLKEGNWGSKRIGQLSLLQEKQSKRAYLVLRNDTGRVTCNLPLSKGLNVSTIEKAKAVTFVATSYSEDDDGNPIKDSDSPIPFMIVVKTFSIAQELKDKIDQALA